MSEQLFLPAVIDPNHKHAFWRSVNDLHDYFGLQVNSNRAKLAYKILEHVPKESFGWCVQKMQVELNTIPRNIGKCYLEFYERWRAEEPQQSKRQHRESSECEHCNSKGVFSFVKHPAPIEGLRQYPIPVTYAARCAVCSNWFGGCGTWLKALDPRDVAALGYEIQLHPLSEARS